MSSPVEIVKQMYAAFSRGDIAEVMSHIADDVEWVAEGPAGMVFTGVRRGKVETMGFFAAIAQEHADPRLEMTEFVSQGDSVASFGRYEATLKRAGKRVNSPVAHLFKFRDGKVVHYTNMLNTAAFLAAPGATTSGLVVSFSPANLNGRRYAEVLQRLSQVTGIPPAGGIFHVCYGEPDRLRVLDVFDTMENYQAFARLLLPIVAEVGIQSGPPEILPVHSE